MVDRQKSSRIDFYRVPRGVRRVLESLHTVCFRADHPAWCEADCVCTGLLHRLAQWDSRMRRAMH